MAILLERKAENHHLEYVIWNACASPLKIFLGHGQPMGRPLGEGSSWETFLGDLFSALPLFLSFSLWKDLFTYLRLSFSINVNFIYSVDLGRQYKVFPKRQERWISEKYFIITFCVLKFLFPFFLFHPEWM